MDFEEEENVTDITGTFLTEKCQKIWYVEDNYNSQSVSNSPGRTLGIILGKALRENGMKFLPKFQSIFYLILFILWL